MNKQILFTQKGYEEKKKEYDQLLMSRPDAVKELAKAREMGDLSENGYYKGARFKLSDIDRRLRQLKHILKLAKVQQNTNANSIDIGTTVTLETGGKTVIYEIVGTYEASPENGKISLYSPLGKTLQGKKKGENAMLRIGEISKYFFIRDIS